MGAQTDQTEPTRAVSVELYEESDPRQSDRLLGTFSLEIDRGDGAQPPQHADPEDAFDEDDYWDEAAGDYDWPALEARRAQADAEVEAQAQADPLRRLAIDDAIALARTFSDKVTVWHEHEPWAAGTLTGYGRTRVWPPDDLDLRPRWYHEPADSGRAAAWWVRLRVEAYRVTDEHLLDAARHAARVLAVRPEASGDEHDRGGAPQDPAVACVDLLVEASDEDSPTDLDHVIEAVRSRLPEPPAVPVPLRHKLAVVIHRLSRRPDRLIYDYAPVAVGHSVRVLGPGVISDDG